MVKILEALPTGADIPQTLMESMLTIDHLRSRPLAALPRGPWETHEAGRLCCMDGFHGR